jgi:hypothetical protein
MKTGQRINLMKKLAARLAEMGWTEGDLVLRQFGLPWSPSWDGPADTAEYFLKMVEQGEVEKLSELHEYLFPGDSLPSGTAAPQGGHWPDGTFRLFLSHSSKKKGLVTEIKQELSEHGIESFVAHADIEPTKEWLGEIRRALNTCQAFAAILCQDFKDSKYCDQEVGHALQRGLLVIPVRVEIDPYGFMAPLQGVSAFEKSASVIAADILKLLLTHPTTKPLMISIEEKATERLVNNFLCSDNFGASSRLLKKLEAYETLPKTLVEKITLNWKKNDQIAGCNGIPRRMDNFLRYHARNELVEDIRSDRGDV